MTTEIKGYVVRGKHSEGGGDVWLVHEPTGEHLIASRKAQRTEFQSLGSAIQAWADAQVLCDEAAIFRVHPDGREERLPSYEEALSLLDAARKAEVDGALTPMQWLAEVLSVVDPLAALEAAEGRLLEAGGWVRIHGDPSKWTWPQTGIVMAQDQAVIVARRRLAAKGGA